MIKLPDNKDLILFDGVCNLCNRSVNFVIRNDNSNRFVFAPLQSGTGEAVIKEFGIDTEKTDSILLLTHDNRLFFKSTAALKISRHLKFPVNLSVIFLIVPTIIRNWVYDYVARNRYAWFGKKDACMIPTPAIKEKFLS